MWRFIQSTFLLCSLTAVLLTALLVPTSVHTHRWGAFCHSHRYAALEERPTAGCTDAVTQIERHKEVTAPKSQPAFLTRSSVDWDQFADISVDQIRQEELFGEANKCVEVNQGESVCDAVHDESTPHIHFNLLGVELTLNLPSHQPAPLVEIVAIEQTRVLEIACSNPNLTSSRPNVEANCVLTYPRGAKVGLKFSEFTNGLFTLEFSNPTGCDFDIAADQFLESAELSVDTPPPRFLLAKVA